jgi:hypothetical protein
MTRDPKDLRLVHIYAQHSQHTEAYILGNREGLRALRAGLDAALEHGSGAVAAMVADGEGYAVEVTLEDSDWNSPTWINTAVPYVASYAAETRANAIWPWNRRAPDATNEEATPR